MNLHLILHDVLYGIDIVAVVFLIGLIGRKAESGTAKFMLIITWICVIIFILSHTIGVSVSDAELSRRFLMFNLVDIFLPLSSAHAVFALLGKNRDQRWVLVISYLTAFILTVFFILNPQQFLQTSVPKMYFPNYYVPGQFYWLMLLFFFSLTVYFLFWMRKMYKVADDVEKKRIKFFAMALLFGYFIGSVDFLLIYNIRVDPLIGFLFVPLSVVPFTYAALQYNLMNITVIAKKALIYAIITALIGGLLSGLNYINVLLTQYYPIFPDWALSIILAVCASIAVYFIWGKARESDILKYEFINVVTHKFRTPLTSIKWITENLKDSAPKDIQEDIRHIYIANERLVELTNLLVNLSGTDDKSYEYLFERLNITTVIDSCVAEVNQKSNLKNIQFTNIIQPDLFINGDMQKIKFVIQTLLDNAINYTPNNGKVIIELSKITSQFSRNRLVISISDTGIGIPKDEIKYIFTKFYRAKNGRKTDTEGMGIGLYLSQKIIERHKGKISVQSAGENLGTTFTIVLPLLD